MTEMKRGLPFYKSKRWQRKRERILRQHDYLCAESKRYGKTAGAEVVHHIYPLEQYPELAYEDWNLLPLTHKMHNTFHDRNNDSVIGKGLEWQEKRRKEFERYLAQIPPSD